MEINIMLNRLASAFCLTMAFSAIFSNQVTLAQSVNIYFRGVVEPRASFSSYTPGKIESSLSGKGGKSTNGFTDITPAKINVQTTNPITITVSSPELVSNSSDIVNTHSATLKINSVQSLGDNVTLPAGKNTVEVDLLSKQNRVFAPGTYTYDITLTMVNP